MQCMYERFFLRQKIYLCNETSRLVILEHDNVGTSGRLEPLPVDSLLVDRDRGPHRGWEVIHDTVTVPVD